MQAMQIHLSQSQDVMLEMGRNVQGLNSPIDSESSFDSFLQREMSEDITQAKEGPPEKQSIESTQSSNETSSEQKSDDSARDSNADSKAQASKNDSLKESEGTENAKSEKSIEENSDGSENEVSLAASHENTDGIIGVNGENASGVASELSKNLSSLHEAKKMLDDENADNALDGQFASTGLEAGKQLFDENGALIASNDTSLKTEGADNLKKSKQVLAEIPTISVLDERSVTQEGKADGNFVRSVNYDGNGNATMDLSLNQNFNGVQNPVGAIVNADGSVQQHTVSNAQQFGTMLSSELQSNSSELVKTGSIILKDGNQGTINLILHPEELGNVKIKLDISDNVLTGRITVASEEAYNAFKANMSSLKEAFDANGFDTAGFDLSWSGEDNAGDNQENDNRNPFGNRYDENIALVSDGEQRIQSIYGHEAYINVVA